MPNLAHRQKHFVGRFCLPPRPNGVMRNHSMLRPGYRCIWFVDTKCIVGILRTYCDSICAEKKLVNTEFYVSISTYMKQTFRSWVVIFHLRQPMAFLSLNLYDTPGLVPRMNVLFWGPGDFPVSYSNRDTSWNAWNRHSGSFMVDSGILFSNMKFPSLKC